MGFRGFRSDGGVVNALAASVPQVCLYTLENNPAGDTVYTDQDWRDAIQRTILAGPEFLRIDCPWNEIETSEGVYDLTRCVRAVEKGTALNYSFWLNLRFLDHATGRAKIPAYLSAVAFDDPAMLTAVNNLLTQLAAVVPRVFCVSLGNEVDTFLTSNPTDIIPYATLLSGAKTKIQTLWGPETHVVASFQANISARTQADWNVYAAIHAETTIACLTYYFINTDFTIRSTDPAEMEQIIGDDIYTFLIGIGIKPFMVEEWGCPSSTVLNSSEELQRACMTASFTAFRVFGELGVIKAVCWLWMSDYPDWILDLVGLTGNQREYIGSIGLRRAADDSPKPAWNEIVTQMDGQLTVAEATSQLALMELSQVWMPGLPLSPGTLGLDDQQQLLHGYPDQPWEVISVGAELAGSATLTLTSTSALLTAIRLSGQATATMTTASALTTAVRFTGTAALTLTSSSTLATAIRVAGAASLTVTATSALTTGIPLIGAASLALTSTSTLSTAIRFTGAADLTLVASGAMSATGAALAGAATLTMSGVGNLLTAIPLTGTASASLTTASSLTTSVRLTGVVAFSLTTASTFSTAIRFAGTASATLTTASALTTGIPLAGASALALTAASALTTQVRFTGTTSLTLTASAAMEAVGATLAGASTLTLTTASALTTALRLAGTASVALTTTSALTTSVRLTGAATLNLTASGAVTGTAAALQGVATASLTTTSTLLTAIRLAGVASLTITSAASLTTGIRLTASALLELTTAASLAPAILPTADVVIVVRADDYVIRVRADDMVIQVEADDLLLAA